MKFKAKRGVYIKCLLIVFFVAPVILVLILPETLDKPIAVAAFFVPFFLFAWIYFDTSYKIEEGMLFYRSGFVRGHIAIERIQKVIKAKTSWSGVRPATAMNGLLIFFNKGDEVYISPENNEVFLDAILKLNKDIQVVS